MNTIRCRRRDWMAALMLGSLAGLMPAGADARGGPLSDPLDGRTPGVRDAVIAGWQRVGAARLDTMRGGFSLPDLQLKIKFGFDQIVLVNDELVATTRLNLEQMRSEIVARTQATVDPQALRARIEASLSQAGLRVSTNPTQTAVTSTPTVNTGAAGTQVATTLTDAATAAGVSADVVAPAADATTVTVVQPTVAQAMSAAPGASGEQGTAGTAGTSASTGVAAGNSVASATMAMPVTVVQSGTGNYANVSAVSGNAITTVVQNNLDGQKIQVFSQIDASVNSGRLLSAMERSAALREATIRSLGR